MIAVVEWLGMQPVGMEIASLNSSQYFYFIFSNIFMHFCNPEVTVLLEYLDPTIYTRLVFSL